MARKALDRFGDDIADKFELFQEWWSAASKELPSAKQLRSYLPPRKQERSIALPIALVIGGLALVGAITLLSTAPVRRFKSAGRTSSARKAAKTNDSLESGDAADSSASLSPASESAER
jgi:hypothetical protein